MTWTPAIVKYWLANYYALREYELNPFEQIHQLSWGPVEDRKYLSGSRPDLSNYAETADLNWEFDKALKKLGKDETRFREIFIDGDGEDDKLFDKFLKILYTVGEDAS